jgi:hypothetical protein
VQKSLSVRQTEELALSKHWKLSPLAVMASLIKSA